MLRVACATENVEASDAEFVFVSQGIVSVLCVT